MKISTVGIPARDAALKGAKYVARAVKSTIGPFGLNALIEKGNKSTNDGYLISKELVGSIENEFERRGATIGFEASSRTNEEVADATSSAWALEDAITDEIVKYLPNDRQIVAKKKPSEIIQLLESGKSEVMQKLQAVTTPVESEEGLVKSALVSVENEQMAELLGKTQWQLGEEGIIIAEDSNQAESSIELVKGIRIDNGISKPSMINNVEKNTLEVSNVSTLLTNYTVGQEELIAMKGRIFEPLIAQKQFSIAIVARGFTSEAIQFCVETAQAGFMIYPINAPYTDQAEVMRDLEALFGGTYVDTEEKRLDDVYITDIGHAETIAARMYSADFAGTDDERSRERISNRIEKLKAKLNGEVSDFEKKGLSTRIAQLTNGFAILKVGAHTPGERKRLKDKADDAVSSVRLALKGGTVKGGGLAFREISDELSEDNILKRPIRVIYDQIMSSAPEGWVIEDWVRDPYLVLESALKNACAVAGELAITNIIVAEQNPKKCKHQEEEE